MLLDDSTSASSPTKHGDRKDQLRGVRLQNGPKLVVRQTQSAVNACWRARFSLSGCDIDHGEGVWGLGGCDWGGVIWRLARQVGQARQERQAGHARQATQARQARQARQLRALGGGRSRHTLGEGGRGIWRGVIDITPPPLKTPRGND